MSQMYIKQWKHNCSVNHSLMDEQPRVTAAVMRVGAEGAFVDNAHAGGRFVGIDVQTGALHHTTLDQYGTRQDVWNNVDYSKNDFQIPCWQQVKDMAVSIAHHTPHMRLISAWIPLLPLVSSR